METKEILLRDYDDMEKGAYLGAIASIATADRKATPDEIEHLMAISEAANLSDTQKEAILQAATELSGDELKKCLDILKSSDLRYSLVADMITFAETDKQYTEEEKANVEKVAQYLEINKQQFSLLDQFVKKTKDTEVSVEEAKKPGFLSSLGLDEKFKSAGLNMGSITKGLLGIAGPLLLANLVRKGFSGGNKLGKTGIGGFGGGGGGLSSIISMLSGGRGFSSSGGLLSRLFRM